MFSEPREGLDCNGVPSLCVPWGGRETTQGAGHLVGAAEGWEESERASWRRLRSVPEGRGRRGEEGKQSPCEGPRERTQAQELGEVRPAARWWVWQSSWCKGCAGGRGQAAGDRRQNWAFILVVTFHLGPFVLIEAVG